MKLKTIYENYKFPNGKAFDSDLTDNPFMSAKEAENINVAYHYSNSSNLEKTGLLTRSEMGLNDLYKAGIDSTYQNAVYLTIDPKQKRVDNQYLYKIDLTKLDRNKFKADEDAWGHSSGFDDENDWVSSIMCMGSFRYEGSIPARFIRLIA
jgi:hypothetical protein